MRKCRILIILALVLSSCTFPSHERYLQRINRWKGQPEAVGMDANGYYFVMYGLLPEKVLQRINEEIPET